MRARAAAERGGYTAELAVALPALFFLLACGLLGIGYADAALRCDDATRAGARAAARGEPVVAVEAASRQAAPRRADIDVQRRTELAEVRCSARVRLAGVQTFRVRARSVAVVEDHEHLSPSGPPSRAGEEP